MDIYVVQPNDSIILIAEKFGVSVEKLIQDNELENPNDLVPGQTIVIVYPELVYTVQVGDSLESIAVAFNVSMMQLLRNNPFLSNRDVYPGEVITISYNTIGQLSTNGYVYPYIDTDTLKKTLPFLTYITIYNYRSISEGDVISYYDDTEIIRISKEYGVIPLMMATTLSPQGEADIETAYNILISNEYQEKQINIMLDIVKTRGYYGVNIVFNYMNPDNQALYQNFITKLSNRIRNEGYFVFVTINSNSGNDNSDLSFVKIDYNSISQVVDNIIFVQFNWGTNYGPPSPVSSIYNIRTFIDYVIATTPSDKVIVGNPLISYDWALPYIEGQSYANSLTINSTLSLARYVKATIQFDIVSQTPFFLYRQERYELSKQHIVWSIDARSILALVELINELALNGAGFWNVMSYFPQLWLVINSQFEIEKLSYNIR